MAFIIRPIICTRLASSRIPQKAIKEINGEPLIHNLCARLITMGLRPIIACPKSDLLTFESILDGMDVSYYYGHDDDPLARMHAAAKANDVQTIIRITHDKVFIDQKTIFEGVNQFQTNNLDYLYSTEFTAGTAFEIISFDALEKAASKFRNIEHISYAIKSVTRNKQELKVNDKKKSDLRLLVDYPEDIDLLQLLFCKLGNYATLDEVLEYYKVNPWIKKLNQMPLLSVYTCAYNEGSRIEQAINSVRQQDIFSDCEYILIDDHSTDDTFEKMCFHSSQNNNVKVIRNNKNLGLASSSNKALEKARGKYIVRLDADDYFVKPDSLSHLLESISSRQLDAVYPNNNFGCQTKVQNGKDEHHVGGAIFSKKAIDHVKFTSGLRGYEGYDFFERAKNQIRIGYLARVIFFYTQRDGSLSKECAIKRTHIKREIDDRISQI